MAQVEWGAPPAYGGGFTQRVSEQGPQRHAGRNAEPYQAPYADPSPDAFPDGQADPYQAYDDERPDPAAHAYAPEAASGNLFNVIGAVLSLGLMLGLGYWGYRLAVRDVTGVPVVRAMAGPMRVQPDDPGGEEAAYQGYAVNDVQANGTAAKPADRLALAPRPTGLAPEDIAPDELSPAAAGGTGTASAAIALPLADAGDDPESAMLALADQLAAGVEPLTEIAPTSTGNATAEDGRATPVQPPVQPVARTTDDIVDQVVNEVASAAEILPASVPGVARSPWPSARPAGLVTQAAARNAPSPAGAATGGVREVAASAIPLGTQLVQLGAFASPEIARAEWDRLAARFSDYFEGKARVVAQATTGGRKFWRLRAMGFENLADARRFCAVLANGRAACIPVVTR